VDPEIPQPPDFSKDVDGPFIITFTAHLPFPVGIPNELGHGIWLRQPFESADYATAYKRPFVSIRVFDQPHSGLPVWQKGTHDALKRFYNFDLEEDPAKRYGEDTFVQHNQWVSLETPWGAVEGEETDPFHRCLAAFNLFLHATQLLTRDVRVRQVSSHDLRPVVIIGALPKNGTWRLLTTMYMHPEAQDESTVSGDKPFDQDELNGALSAIATRKPFLTTALWRARAQRALRQTGDGADAVISFQIAAESLLFETYRMLLIDEGLSSAEVETELNRDRPFKRFFTEIFPLRLGGDWHIDHPGTPVSTYWRDLYLVRNSIIHTGMVAHTGHAEVAQKAYWGLRDHLEDRLWANYRKYPRTTFARLGEEGLEKRDGMTAWMRKFIKLAEAEPAPWHWPYDLAGRSSP
jgi:hypothetical protein